MAEKDFQISLSEAAPKQELPLRATTDMVVFEYERPAAAVVPLCFKLSALSAMRAHCMTDRSRELGGALIGRRARWQLPGEAPFEAIELEHALPAQHITHTHTNITFTHATWNAFSAELDANWSGLKIMGWYHTHPGFGIFLSEFDQFIQQNFFSAPGQVAVVYDPVQGKLGAFQQGPEGLRRVGFWLFGPIGTEARMKELLQLMGLAGPDGLARQALVPVDEAALAELSRLGSASKAALEAGYEKRDQIAQKLASEGIIDTTV